jgi:hypothetical protein
MRGVWRERLKVVREKEKANNVAEGASQKQERDYVKAIQLPQKGKTQASQAAS